MNFYHAQLKLFDIAPQVIFNYELIRFVVKWHYAVTKTGLHFDLRIEHLRYDKKGRLVKGELESFVVKGDNFLDAEAILVNVHSFKYARREGTIIDQVGAGAVLHFDEGYALIPNVSTTRQMVEAFDDDFKRGNLTLLFDGYKMKGHFNLKRKRGNKWQLTKMDDEWNDIHNKLFANKHSILPEERPLGFYMNRYETQLFEYEKLPTQGAKQEYINLNHEQSLQYKKANLPERPHKIFRHID